MIGIREYSIELILVMVLGGAVAFFGYLGYGLATSDPGAKPFLGEQAMIYVEEQMNLGPRVAGGDTADAYQEWAVDLLTSNGWNVVIQPFLLSGENLGRNIIATNLNEADNTPVIIVGAHYDTRLSADADPDPENRELPAPGANSGASGPAVLLELARTLRLDEIDYGICLAFFDASENGGIEGWTSAQGSTHFIESLATQEELARCAVPSAAVIIDMVGSNNQLTYDQNSERAIVNVLRQVADELSYDDWLREQPSQKSDGDHIPFLSASIPVVTIWDSSYPHRATVSDTASALNAESLQRTGDVLKQWLESSGQASGTQ